jgi:hypothetical protein
MINVMRWTGGLSFGWWIAFKSSFTATFFVVAIAFS